MITEKKAANAMVGKTARACDSCLRKRARWFCAADDAFLCQACDASVHSANQLASRHQRVRLQTSSFKGSNDESSLSSSSPAWHRGFTRKARTTRHKAKQAKEGGDKNDEDKVLMNHQPLPFVPEMSNEEGDDKSPNYDENEDEEQLLYRVPVFDPFAAELCNPTVDDDHHHHHHHDTTELTVADDELTVADDHDQSGKDGSDIMDHHEVLGFLPSELELAEFAADVESLLGGGGGLEEEYSCDHDVKGFGIMELLDCKEEEEEDIAAKARVKLEDEEDNQAMLMEEAIACEVNPYACFNEKFDYDELSSVREGEEEEEEEDEEEGKVVIKNEIGTDRKMAVNRDILLRLNYEAVIAAWASQGSPWTTGTRPEVNPDHGWPDHMDTWRINNGRNANGDLIRGAGGSTDVEGREARVSRYREKRRTRLFSKKIRYEVRKLNAEKRPRMKGRFVKRTSFMSPNSSTSTTSTSTTFHFNNQHIMNK
ncbi:Zinc finger-domain containing protein [Trema orientale]|uniref:Zinc finger-domain containing protein n=1 Tax=Trema orientale TaxID=63057 RepID=A0A2P5F9N1_TREOI|nr:Zinc finger-domain containing protein [Trema orientale]